MRIGHHPGMLIQRLMSHAPVADADAPRQADKRIRNRVYARLSGGGGHAPLRRAHASVRHHALHIRAVHGLDGIGDVAVTGHVAGRGRVGAVQAPRHLQALVAAMLIQHLRARSRRAPSVTSAPPWWRARARHAVRPQAQAQQPRLTTHVAFPPDCARARAQPRRSRGAQTCRRHRWRSIFGSRPTPVNTGR